MGNKTGLVINKKIELLIFLLFLGVVVIYFSTSGGNTPFNHFILLAGSFLKGKIYIQGYYPWLEKIPIDSNTFYVANPPGPAILAIPFVFLFGKNFPQQYIAHLVGAGIAVVTFLISLEVSKKNIKLAFWSAILVSLGSINWYLSSVGSTWYLAHLVSEFFISLAILFSFQKRSPFWVGFLIGIAYISRIPSILLFPIFLYFYRRNWIKSYTLLLAGVLPFIFLNFCYNFLRFGFIWDIGYTMIPGVDTEPWFQNGLVNIKYIPSHLQIFFLALPDQFYFWKNNPSNSGYAIWFTTPAFLYSLRARLKDKKVIFSWVSIILVCFIIFSHGSTGFSQFGYRFATDFYPVLVLLTIWGVSKQKDLSWHHWALLIFGIVVNFWGVSNII